MSDLELKTKFLFHLEENSIEEVIKLLNEYKYLLNEVIDEETGRNLLHLSVYYHSQSLLEYLLKQPNLKINQQTHVPYYYQSVPL